jgi:hypothetical protein
MSRFVSGLLRKLRPVAPLTLVTGFAMYGQMVYWLQNATRPDAPVYERVGIAVGAAVAMESIALYVQWHAHDALLNKATATAARLRRASYAVAFGIAALNYSHFSHDWAPTPAAAVFALFSAIGPWLWGLHTRRVQHLQLLREGQADTSGAVFSAERFRNFPVRTWKARRWSIDYGITDPRIAWESYRVERLRLEAARAADRVSPVPVDMPAETADAMPAFERYEDAVVPDLDKVDDNGLSLHWVTAPQASGPVTPKPERSPARSAAAPRNVDMARLRELAEKGAGRRTVAKVLGITEHQARAAVDSLKTNGHQVTS